MGEGKVGREKGRIKVFTLNGHAWGISPIQLLVFGEAKDNTIFTLHASVRYFNFLLSLSVREWMDEGFTKNLVGVLIG